MYLVISNSVTLRARIRASNGSKMATASTHKKIFKSFKQKEEENILDEYVVGYENQRL